MANDITDPEQQLAAQWAQTLAESLKMLQQMSGGGALSQLGGMGVQQPGTTNPPIGFRASPVGTPGQSVGPNYGPSGVLFGGGSPFPVDFGPARLQNAMIAIRDIINASNQFKNSPLGQKLGAKLGGK